MLVAPRRLYIIRLAGQDWSGDIKGYCMNCRKSTLPMRSLSTLGADTYWTFSQVWYVIVGHMLVVEFAVCKLRKEKFTLGNLLGTLAFLLPLNPSLLHSPESQLTASDELAQMRNTHLAFAKILRICHICTERFFLCIYICSKSTLCANLEHIISGHITHHVSCHVLP